MSQTAPAPTQMSDLYTRLATIGLPKKYLKTHILPDWWTDEVDETPGVVLEGAMYLAYRLNLDLRSLFTEEVPQFATINTAKFKTQNGTESQQLLIPRALSLYLAELIAHACPHPYQPIDHETVPDIRTTILKNYPSISLTGLLNYCWSRGIPVFHFNRFPPNVRRFHGMVAHIDDRPVIILSLNDPSPARQLFILAHELGHILKGHLAQDDCLIDATVQLESDDEEENEANQVAAELLLGQPGISYDLWNHYLSHDMLVARSRQLAPINNADPGVIALNIIWNRAHRAPNKKAECIAWATGKKALQELEPNANALSQIHNQLLTHLDWDKIHEDNRDYLALMLNLSTEQIQERVG